MGKSRGEYILITGNSGGGRGEEGEGRREEEGEVTREDHHYHD